MTAFTITVSAVCLCGLGVASYAAYKRQYDLVMLNLLCIFCLALVAANQ